MYNDLKRFPTLQTFATIFAETGKMTDSRFCFSMQPRGKRPLRVMWLAGASPCGLAATLEPLGAEPLGLEPKWLQAKSKFSRTPCPTWVAVTPGAYARAAVIEPTFAVRAALGARESLQGGIGFATPPGAHLTAKN